MEKFMRSSYDPKDVTVLLKDITGLVKPLPAEKREPLIQSGVHYCEMLPLEYDPSPAYIREYENALRRFSGITAECIAEVSERIIADKNAPVLVSLARAGLPAGIMIKHYLEKKYGAEIPHYAISIIRGRGIDKNAMKYILSRHSPDRLQFVDGWTGKGAIQDQVTEAMKDFECVDSRIAVISDPAYITPFCGTHEDFLIASSCLNSVVSGLMSRTFLRSDIIGEADFHGAAYYGELEGCDRSYEYINAVEACMKYEDIHLSEVPFEYGAGRSETAEVAKTFGISDINLVKPGIGETTRVLLRRVPNMVLIAEDAPTEYVAHILELAGEKGVPVGKYPLKCYRACGIIKNMPGDM
ncbi:MAG: cysteine protease StiP family protein [Oscillospiraceae bacterium]|nr:cysteine protease StiP family protein [Oscillospiraceae bacterium]